LKDYELYAVLFLENFELVPNNTTFIMLRKKEYQKSSAATEIEEAEEQKIPAPPEAPEVKEEPPVLVEEQVDEPKENPQPVIQPDPQPSLIGDLLVCSMNLSPLLNSICTFKIENYNSKFFLFGFRV
jgi:hypothetical protein